LLVGPSGPASEASEKAGETQDRKELADKGFVTAAEVDPVDREFELFASNNVLDAWRGWRSAALSDRTREEWG